MKIALAQINTRVGDFVANSSKILTYIENAQTAGADLVVFPELCVCGYPPRDLVESYEFRERNRFYTEELAKKIGNIGVIVGAVTGDEDTPFNRAHNSAIFLRNGRVEMMQHKTLLPTYDVFDEARNFVPATRQRVMQFRGLCCGITVCEDVWNSHKFWSDLKKTDPYKLDPVTAVVQRGAEIIINISASPFHIDKHNIRNHLLKNIAVEHRIPVVYVNAVGGNDHLIFDGGSMVMDSDGQVAAQAKQFEEDLVLYDTATESGDIHAYNELSQMEQLFQALVLGVRDYVHKCGFSKAVIGLSGGIDSAVTACIAVHALGHDNVTGITMPSEFSSDGSVDDSRQLAENLGIKLYQIPIQDVKDKLLIGFQWAKSVKLYDGQPELFDYDTIKVTGLADENIQARIRGLILMTYSNQTGALVLSTGNKSELAVGYCTLYGDMCGGLAVISDVPKTMVYQLATYLNCFGTPIPASTMTKPPSAELAPGQYDQQCLPPYEVLDLILQKYVEESVPVDEIVRMEGIDRETVVKIVRLIDRAEYKRWQSAPGLKVLPKSFGYGRRYPIAHKPLY